METRRLGSSGPALSLIGYGAWEASGHWGSDLDEGEIVEAIRAGVEAGINWIDTAEVYGPHTSEEIVGRAIKDLDVLVATKVAPKPAGSGFQRDEVRKACEGSLARLGRSAIDLYQLHWPDGGSRVEETWEAMCELQDEGLVHAIGVSNFGTDLIERCSKIRHVDSIQPQLSMLHRDNAELIRWCGERGIGVVAYGPLAYGILTGAITDDTTFARDDWRSGQRGFVLYEEFFKPENLRRHLPVVDSLRPIAARLEMSLADLAIAWVLAQPGVTSAIVGSRDPRHVVGNVRAASVALAPGDLAEIDALIPA